MANGQHGGYRRPANPAPVSGPGALSARTDGGPGGPRPMDVTGMSYGENGALNEAQTAAPMSAPPPGGGAPMAPPTPPTGLGDPTAFPDQPVTAGADAGAGPSSADIGLSQSEDAELRAKLGPRLPVLMRMADAPYATAAYRRDVRRLIARITT